MNSEKYLPLTETTFYILVALIESGHGYSTMQKVEELSHGCVRVAAGTMYGALENLLKLKLIKTIPADDNRRKVYKTTSLGIEVLNQEVKRLKRLIEVAENYKVGRELL